MNKSMPKFPLLLIVALCLVCGDQAKAQTQAPVAQKTKNPEVLRFGLVADTNVSQADATTVNWEKMIKLAEQNQLDFVVIAGDIVNDARQMKQWERLEYLLEKHDFRVETVPGNHELRIIHEDKKDVFNRVFSLDRYHAATGQPTNRSFRYANAYFITVYSGGLKRGDVEWADFLKSELATAADDESVDWIFVVDHFDSESLCFPHAFPKFGGFDRPALIAEATSGHDNIIWLSGDESSKFQYEQDEAASPRAEFVPRENRSMPGFWRFDVYRDGRLNAQVVKAKMKAKDGKVIEIR